MSIEVRSITSNDLHRIVALVRELAVYEGLMQYCQITVERLDAATFGEGAVVEGLIAMDGESAIGYALFFPNFSSFRGQLGLYLDDIYVKETYRGKGIGESMLRQIARIAASRGLERIDFLVQEHNTAAIEFYKKLGAETNADERHLKFGDAAFARLSESTAA